MAPRWTDAPSRYAAVTGVDPYIDLTFGTAEPHFFPSLQEQEWISVLLRLADPASISDFVDGTDWSQGLPWNELVHVPALYRRPAAGLAAQKHCTAHVRRREFLDFLERSSSLQNAISRITLGSFPEHYSPPAEEAEPDDEQSLPEGVPEIGTVVMGIIDDGLAFAHERFRSSELETRIEYLWLQDGTAGSADARLPYGREIRKQEIDALLGHEGAPRFANEDELYRRAGVLDLSLRRTQSIGRRAAHGTHVTDLACGFDFRRGSRYDRPIVAVQLPAATTEDTSGATLDDFGLDAIRYILDRADAIARRRGSARLPVVINFSYGNVAGPHDGSSDLEQAIDALVRARGETPDGKRLLQVVLPAGNSNLARLHAKVTLTSKPFDLHWRVLPDDRTPSFMEIWLPDAAPDQVRLRIRAPGSEEEGVPSSTLAPAFNWQRTGACCARRAAARFLIRPVAACSSWRCSRPRVRSAGPARRRSRWRPPASGP